MASVGTPVFPQLQENIRADVCIIGAGIAGMSTAYLLAREGRSVAVVDDGPMGGGETCHTTAHLTNAIDDRYFEIERLHGEVGLRIAAESQTMAIDRIEAIVRDEKIKCNFERLDGYLFLREDDKREVLQRELEAAHKAGLLDVELLPRVPLKDFDFGPCLRFPRQGQFHPLRYLSGLAAAIQERGGRIFSRSHARFIKGGHPCQVEMQNGAEVNSDAIVVATNTPVNDWVVLHTKQAPYRTYVIGARIPRGSVPKALYWDTGSPYHYIRIAEDERPSEHSKSDSGREILIIGGEDHKTGQADDADARYARLESWARKRFPVIEEVEFRWSGQVTEPVDGVAFIGKNPMDEENVYVATGDSGQGMTHGTIAGILLTDLIAGRENRWAGLYDPARKSLRSLKEFAGENLNVAGQYVDWVTGGDVDSVDQIAPDSGAVIRRGMHKVAIYRDPDGVLHEFSARCVHLGCVVAWNSAEKTWDCPCHGSRFDSNGRVVNGPANGDLDPAPGKDKLSS
jgi:glycine/D-amino acid oxidase-like deaminating enzyme/nitrite reductase/ring-hydroxylating ferredoxin subunit